MKKRFAIIIVISLMFSQIAFPADNVISVYLDGVKVSFGYTNGKQDNAVIVYDYAYVPIARIIEVLTGERPKWNDVTKTSTFSYNGVNYAINTEKNGIYINGEFVRSATGTPPVIINDRLLIPLKMLTSIMGFTQVWDESTRSTYLTSPPKGASVQQPGTQQTTQVQQPSTQQTTQTNPVTVTEHTDAAEQMLELINAERKKAGVSPLTLDKTLIEAANIRAEEISRSFTHNRPNGSKFSTVLEELNYKQVGFIGENIAAGNKTAADTFNQWMNSSGHKANMLNENYTKIGIGYYETTDGYKYYWVQIFSK